MNILLGSFGTKITIIDLLVRTIISIIIGSIIGFERERKNRPAGLRTHVLVSLASTMIALVEQQMIYEINSLSSTSINLSLGRLSVGVITGIGFIGAGTIMTANSKIVGLTTAASLWCTACLGLINGMGYCVPSLAASILVITVLKVLRIGERTNLNRTIKIDYLFEENVSSRIENVFSQMNVRIIECTLSFHKNDNEKYCTAYYSIVFKDKKEIRAVMTELFNVHNVVSVKIQNIT